jgi:hypothetical protein
MTNFTVAHQGEFLFLDSVVVDKEAVLGPLAAIATVPKRPRHVLYSILSV